MYAQTLCRHTNVCPNTLYTYKHTKTQTNQLSEHFADRQTLGRTNSRVAVMCLSYPLFLTVIIHNGQWTADQIGCQTFCICGFVFLCASFPK